MDKLINTHTQKQIFPLFPNLFLIMAAVPSIIPTVQAIHERSQSRRPRKGCLYNAEELHVLNKHKEDYRSKTTHRERASLLRTTIFVDIFNYWDFKQITLDEKEIQDRMQVWMSL